MNNNQAINKLSIAAALLLAACSPGSSQDAMYAAATGAEKNIREVIINDYQDALDLFQKLGYTPEAWQSGIREIPRIYLAEISDQWSKVTTKEIDVLLKKRLFFRAIGPLALRSNELVLEERTRLENVAADSTPEQAEWLNALAEDYGLSPGDFPDKTALAEELLIRVDTVPPSLVLAQAAEESGWGTSRFAFKGNALFGQWTWGGDGIRPEQQRSGKGDYKIAAFESPLKSVQAHARNLNSHRAYADFRKARAKLRQQGKRISGHELAGTLTGYSERGSGYVKSLRNIIEYNKLDSVDDAYLYAGQPIVLIRTDGTSP